MKYKAIILLLVILMGSTNGCEGYGSHRCGSNETDRVGAVCNDGTTSSSTGSGTCSSHGGVKYWLCAD